MKMRIRKLSIILLLLLCIGASACVERENTESTNEEWTFYENISSGGVSYASSSISEVSNIVIFICFFDDDVSAVRNTVSEEIIDSFVGEDNSLKDYYSHLSNGKLTVNTLFPLTADGDYYIYQDGYTRSYYNNNSSQSGSGRTGPESKLLNNAITSAEPYLHLNGINLDQDGDGYVDSVTFLVSGAYQNDSAHWGRIMWPHSWQLDEITQEYNSSSSSARLNGILVNDYTFSFLGAFSKVGLICHETGHAVGGLPDLYHYTYDTNYLPVGYWDLMHLDCETPQFMTTYMRWKYWGFIDDEEILELTKSGQYTLQPTTTTKAGDAVACRITLSEAESIWIEYRRNDVSTYDSDLPGSGLIVYRTNSSATLGNQKSKHNSAIYPEELFIFRPDCAGAPSGTQAKEKYNLGYAYLSKYNANFSYLGDSQSTSKYSTKCIYTSNGKNTGIVLTIDEESTEQITFTVALGKYDVGAIDSAYIMGKDRNGADTKNETEIYYGEEISVQLYVQYKNREVPVLKTDFSLDYTYEVCPNGQVAYFSFTADDGTEYKYPFTLRIFDKLLPESATVSALPKKTTYMVGESFSLDGLSLSVKLSSGLEREIAYGKDNQSLWTVEGIDMNRCGKYTVFVVYDNNVTIRFEVCVKSDILSVYVSERDSWHLCSATQEPVFTVMGNFADGTTDVLDDTLYTVEYPKNIYYSKVSVKISVDENIFCYTYVYNTECEVTAWAVETNPQTQYRYGEGLKLSEGRVQATFANGFSLDGQQALSLENFYSYLVGSYNPTKTGGQTLTAKVQNQTLRLSVYVLPVAENLLTSLSEKIAIREGVREGIKKNYILLSEDMTLTELTACLTSYLPFLYRFDDVTMTETSYTGKVSDKLYLFLQNEDGTEIAVWQMARVGDTDSDGTLTEKDKEVWEQYILDGTSEFTFDKTGDGRFTLTDFILLADEVKP